MRSFMLADFLQAAAFMQTGPFSVSVDICKVVALPTEYSGIVLSVEGPNSAAITVGCLTIGHAEHVYIRASNPIRSYREMSFVTHV